uniref:Cnidarian restricted protein n=1 Tax=Clytia hemisphaerica TaxID=252671 RepID=A0A7M5U9T0_9CNID
MTFLRRISLLLLLFGGFLLNADADVDVDRIRNTLSRVLQDPSIPPNIARYIAMLHDGIDFLKCLPIYKKSSRCYISKVCKTPKLNVKGVLVPFQTEICKRPYKIVIHLQSFKTPWEGEVLDQWENKI